MYTLNPTPGTDRYMVGDTWAPRQEISMLGPTELVIILGIVMLLFGSTRLPKLAKSLGEAQRELRAATGEFEAPSKDDPIALPTDQMKHESTSI